MSLRVFLCVARVGCCVCVCIVYWHPIYSGRQVCGRTSRGRPREEGRRVSSPCFCGACLNFYREEDPAVPFTSSSVKSNFVSFSTTCRKNRSSCDDSEIRTHVPTSEGFEVTT